MIESIGHVGIIVKNLDEAVELYCRMLGLEKPDKIMEWPTEGMRNVILKVGNSAFEVMEPYPGTSLAKFLEQRGEGLHHVNLEVKDSEAYIGSLKAKGATIIERSANTCFVHPKSTRGILLEIVPAE